MTEQTAYVEDVRSRTYDLLQAVGATIVSLAVVAALGTWLFIHQGTGGPPVSAGADRQPAAGVAVQGSAGSTPPIAASTPVGADARAVGRSTAFDVLSAQTLYLVASQGQADALRAGIEELNAVRVALELQPLAHEIVVLATDEDEATYWLSRAEEDTVREVLGMPAPHVVDLRGRGN